jgi:hypothetical protein
MSKSRKARISNMSSLYQIPKAPESKATRFLDEEAKPALASRVFFDQAIMGTRNPVKRVGLAPQFPKRQPVHPGELASLQKSSEEMAQRFALIDAEQTGNQAQAEYLRGIATPKVRTQVKSALDTTLGYMPKSWYSYKPLPPPKHLELTPEIKDLRNRERVREESSRVLEEGLRREKSVAAHRSAVEGHRSGFEAEEPASLPSGLLEEAFDSKDLQTERKRYEEPTYHPFYSNRDQAKEEARLLFGPGGFKLQGLSATGTPTTYVLASLWAIVPTDYPPRVWGRPPIPAGPSARAAKATSAARSAPEHKTYSDAALSKMSHEDLEVIAAELGTDPRKAAKFTKGGLITLIRRLQVELAASSSSSSSGHGIRRGRRKVTRRTASGRRKCPDVTTEQAMRQAQVIMGEIDSHNDSKMARNRLGNILQWLFFKGVIDKPLMVKLTRAYVANV